MTSKTEYLAENEKYIGDETLAALEQIPEDLWGAVAEIALDEGWEDIGIDCAAAITHETLEDIENSRQNSWSDIGRRDPITGFQLPGTMYYKIQIAKGQPRRSLMVIDLGDKRLCLS